MNLVKDLGTPLQRLVIVISMPLAVKILRKTERC